MIERLILPSDRNVFCSNYSPEKVINWATNDLASKSQVVTTMLPLLRSSPS